MEDVAGDEASTGDVVVADSRAALVGAGTGGGSAVVRASATEMYAEAPPKEVVVSRVSRET